MYLYNENDESRSNTKYFKFVPAGSYTDPNKMGVRPGAPTYFIFFYINSLKRVFCDSLMTNMLFGKKDDFFLYGPISNK